MSGNRLLDARSGLPISIAGVNRSGSEYACAQGWGLFDGPVTDDAIAAVAAWGTNAIRIPLNESCWLGINGVNPTLSGTTYRTAISELVERAARHGLAVILDLHWAAPGSALATGQQVAPDADHTYAFWSSVATTFSGSPSVMFELFNEPHDISWDCWRNGCTTAAGWTAAGAQDLVNTIRATGATQPIIVDGLDWGGDLSQWAQHAPRDPYGELVAGWHVYNFSGCHDTACWDSTVTGVAEHYPVLITEVGEDDCGTSFLDQILGWADAHAIGYLAWSWNTASCGSGPALITNYDGTPTPFGAGYQRHLAERGTPPTADPTPEPTAPSAPTPTPVVPPGPTTTPPTTPLPGPALPPPTRAPAANPRPIDRAALFDFEDGTTQGWSTRWGSITVSPSGTTPSSGSRSLELTLSAAGYPAVGTGQHLAGVHPGSDVGYRVWIPSPAPSSTRAAALLAVSPVVFDAAWHVSVLPARGLHTGWNTIIFQVPTTVGTPKVMGLQIDNPGGWTGTLALDRVTLAQPRQSFEDGGTAGWRLRHGRASLVNTRAAAYDGHRSLQLTLRSGTSATLATAQVQGLLPGSIATIRIWDRPGARGSVTPFVDDPQARIHLLPRAALAPGWNSLTFIVPAGLTTVSHLGLRCASSPGRRGSLLIDAITW